MADDVVPQGFPSGLPGPVGGRCRIGLRAGAAKRAGTLTRSRRRVAPRRDGVVAAGERAGGAQQVVRDHRAQQPGGVGAEASRRYLKLMAGAWL